MFDRFKFRVYEKNENKMSYSETEFFDDMIGLRFNHFGIDTETIDDLILMQCTGLKDKNKKLVFEGDIVKSYNDEICEIKFDKDEACFFITSEWNSHPMSYLDFKFKIIGNIYENPELLTDEN